MDSIFQCSVTGIVCMLLQGIALMTRRGRKGNEMVSMYYTTHEWIEHEDYGWFVECVWHVEPYLPGTWDYPEEGGAAYLMQAIDRDGFNWAHAWAWYQPEAVRRSSCAAYAGAMEDGEDLQAQRQIEALDAAREGDWDDPERDRTNVWKGK